MVQEKDPSLVQGQQKEQNGTVISALSSIAPALASTACCWGPAILSVFGAAGSTSSSVFSQVSKFRPQFLALSATMISFSFYNVYGPPSQQECTCCTSEEEIAENAKILQINRAVTWGSLGVALAGASYGRVAWPKPFFAHFKRASPIGPIGAAASLVGKKSVSISPSHLRFQVEGMHCGGCASKIKRAIESIDGIQKAVVDHKTGSVVVEVFSGDVNKEAIREAIAKVGYSVGGW